MLIRTRNFLLCLLPTLLPAVVRAEGGDATATYEWKNSWSSPSSRSLGGSQTAHAFNEDALFANPAALSKTRHPRSRKTFHAIDFPGLSVGGNKAGQGIFKGQLLKPSEWLKTFATLTPEGRNYLEVQAFPWTVLGERGGPTFFVGMPVRSTFTADPSSDGGLTRKISTQSTATAAFNMTLTTRTGAVAFGLSARPNVRWNSSASYSLNDMVSSKTVISKLKADAGRTLSTPVDAGFIATAGDFWLPSFALSVINLPTACVDNFLNPATGKTQSICGAPRRGQVNEDMQATRLDPTEVRAGVSIVPRVRMGRVRLNLKVSGDIYPLPVSYSGKNFGYRDVNINQLTHAGVELFVGNALSTRNFALRAGLNSTRVSLGLSLPFPHFSIEMASYEAAIFEAGRQAKERRYIVGVSSDW